jgi:pyruvate dehydrogenase E1 component alpha subunit/2-oxoisovalerate dehydrogenase E1 component alpha subunit
MSSTLEAPATNAPAAQQRDRFCEAFRWMLLARILEEKYASLYRAGKIFGGVFISKGQEALSAAVGMSLHKGDIFSPLIRDQAGRLAFGETLLDATRTVLGSPLGPMRARDGNVHRGHPREGYLAMISHLGAMIPVVAGTLMAKRMRGETGFVGATCIGDGATSTGAFHEGLNLAAVEKLPFVLVVANNQYAYSTPTSRQFACEDLVQRAAGYGVGGHSVDGTDLAACLDVVGKAVALARGGNGPQLIVASLLRLAGHGEHDDAGYIDPTLKKSKLGEDCLKKAEELILKNSWADTATVRQWRSEAARKVDESVATVQREAAPDPNKEDWVALATANLVDTFTGE